MSVQMTLMTLEIRQGNAVVASAACDRAWAGPGPGRRNYWPRSRASWPGSRAVR